MNVQTLWSALLSAFKCFYWLDAIDIAVVTALIFVLLKWSKQTRAYGVLKGIGILLVVYLIVQLGNLNTISWILNLFFDSIFVVIVILFQPELRNALDRLSHFGTRLSGKSESEDEKIVRGVAESIENMARQRVGALIVFERKTPLDDYCGKATNIDAVISGPLLENIFVVNTPLHDGAVIVRDNRIVCAACVLPVSDDPNIALKHGTRHRAAIAISTVSDAFVIVVSEERGVISFAEGGRLTEYIDNKTLNDKLNSLLIGSESDNKSFVGRIRRMITK